MLSRLVPRLPTGLVLALLLGGCADWPRWNHLPENDPNAVDAPEDPGSLILREWIDVPEDGDEPWDPTKVSPTVLDRTDALLVEGTLDGIGWSDVATPREIHADPQCSDASSPRNPTTDGDWLADVDAWVVTAPGEGGQLCASLQLEDTDVGWDLLLAKLDECQVPVSFASDAGAFVGYSQGGANGGWGELLEGGATYAVLVAGYYPNDHARQVPYRLGLSLVGTSTGAIGPCPQPPPPGTP